MCVYCVDLLCIYKYTHIQYIFWKYLHVYIWRVNLKKQITPFLKVLYVRFWLKHKNAIICLQIFKKHVKLTLVYLKNNATVSYSLLKMCVQCRKVCLCFGLCNPPTASLPNCISAPRVVSCWKTQRISFQSWKLPNERGQFLLESSIWQP